MAKTGRPQKGAGLGVMLTCRLDSVLVDAARDKATQAGLDLRSAIEAAIRQWLAC